MPETKNTTNIFFSKKFSTDLLEKELLWRKFVVLNKGEGWVSVAQNRPNAPICFAYAHFYQASLIESDTLNHLAQKLVEDFCMRFKNITIEAEWPLTFFHQEAQEGIGKRAHAVEKMFLDLIRKKMSRVAKLAQSRLPHDDEENIGYFVFFDRFNRVFASSQGQWLGSRRMKDDPDAPSRSFLKVEEAYFLLKDQPSPSEIVVDLGAAPGGWSYSAAKRSAEVIAVDNGPLKGAAKNHPNITHDVSDAFHFKVKKQIDWLFCDMVEDPYRIIELIRRWLLNSHCNNFIVNLKVGQADPIDVMIKAHERLEHFCRVFKMQQLYHDRSEITLVGKIKHHQ